MRTMSAYLRAPSAHEHQGARVGATSDPTRAPRMVWVLLAVLVAAYVLALQEQPSGDLAGWIADRLD